VIVYGVVNGFDPLTGKGGAQQLQGGCSATGGLEVFALVGMLRALWRRRRA
jgi:uncharacterized protein (TIGR03382 family)